MGVGSARVGPEGSWGSGRGTRAQRRQKTAGLREGSFYCLRGAELLPLFPKDTHALSCPCAMALGDPLREEEVHTAPRGSQVREEHKSDHMLLRHVSGCKHRAEGASLLWSWGAWSILGGGSRCPAPFQAQEQSQRGSGKLGSH